MCYEASLTKDKPLIEFKYKAKFKIDFEFEPFYHRSAFGYPNLYIIKQDEQDGIYPSTWGLVPEYSLENVDGFRKKYNTYNARSQSIFTSGVYKKSAFEKRCLIIADGFFEPHKEGKISIPYYCYIPSKIYKDGRDLFLTKLLYY